MYLLLDIAEYLLPILYGITFVLYLKHFMEGQGATSFMGSKLLTGTVGFHAIYLTARGIELEHFPVATTGEFATLLAISIGVVYLFIENRHEKANTGPFFVAIVLAFQVIASLLLGDLQEWPARSQKSLYSIHVIFTVFGFAALSIGAIYAVMYILLSKQLKSRDLGVIFKRLPPLNILEKMSRLATIAGIILLGAGLALGHIVAVFGAEQFDFTDPIIIVADLIWSCYLVGWVVVAKKQLSGLKVGYLAVSGYVVLLTSVVGVVLFSGSFHQGM
jgi:ABC-type transport system involved in cytochrome c biogenesis permease subunit